MRSKLRRRIVRRFDEIAAAVMTARPVAHARQADLPAKPCRSSRNRTGGMLDKAGAEQLGHQTLMAIRITSEARLPADFLGLSFAEPHCTLARYCTTLL